MGKVLVSRDRRELVLEIPALTSVGEEFDLSGENFERGSVGVVSEVLGQSAGMTKVRIDICEGQLLSRELPNLEDHVPDREPPPSAMEQHDLPRTVHASPVNNDPRPRSGNDHHVVPGMPVDDSGTVVVVSGEDSKVNGLDSLSAPDPTTLPNQLGSISNIISKAVGGTSTPVTSQSYSTEEHAESMGVSVDNRVGAKGGIRKSRYNLS